MVERQAPQETVAEGRSDDIQGLYPDESDGRAEELVDDPTASDLPGGPAGHAATPAQSYTGEEDQENRGDGYQVVADTVVRFKGVKIKKIDDKIKGISRDFTEVRRDAIVTFDVGAITEIDLRRLQLSALYGHTVNLSVWMNQMELAPPSGQLPMPEETYREVNGDAQVSSETAVPEDGLGGFKLGDEVIVKESGELGIVQGSEGPQLVVVDEAGLGKGVQFFPGQLEHRPEGETPAKPKNERRRQHVDPSSVT